MHFVQSLFRRIRSDWSRELAASTQIVRSMIEPGHRNKPGRCRARAAASCAAALVAMNGLLNMAAVQAAELTPRDMALLDRLTWGISASSAAHLQAIGTERWLSEQLHPGPDNPLPERAQAQIEAMPGVHKFPFDIAVEFEQQGKTANQTVDPDQKKAAQQAFQQAMNDRAKQAAARSILRALYAPDQLRERMTWFWFNHFNVHQYKANLRMLVGDYEDRAIRPLALGHFRDLLSATLRHPAMLRYLDNADNAAGHHQRKLRPRDHGTAHHGRRLRLHPERCRGAGAHPDRRRHRPQAGRSKAQAGTASRSWCATARSNSIRPATITATRFSSARPSRAAGSPRSTRPSTSCCAIPRPRTTSRAPDRDVFRLGQSAGGAGRADGADVQAHRRRYRRACWPRCSMRRSSRRR